MAGLTLDTDALIEFERWNRRVILHCCVCGGALALTGSVETTWAFSAFTVLVYYALTNLAALRLPKEARLYPRWVTVCGLMACVFMAFWVPPRIGLSGLALVGVGLVWHSVARKHWSVRRGEPRAPEEADR